MMNTKCLVLHKSILIEFTFRYDDVDAWLGTVDDSRQ